MTRSYPDHGPRPTLPNPFYVRPRRDWNCLQVAALVLVIEAAVFVALLWGQGWRP